MPRSALLKARDAPSSTKARILRAAEEVFAAKGFEGASTREIASAAGVNISSLHYHWESKETLYFAVFENINDRIVELVRSSIPESSQRRPSRSVIDESVGELFDFFTDNPNVPKLLVRRLLEAADGGTDIERDILLPAWQLFVSWTHSYALVKTRELDVPIFVLTACSVLLLFTLDSQPFLGLLGGSVRSPALRERLRAHVIHLVHLLLSNDQGRGDS